MFDNPLHPYTKALFSAIPIPDPETKIRRIVLQGDIPSPANPPKGCKFHTRCNECMSACRLLEPEFRDAGGGHMVACHKYDEEVMGNAAYYDELLVKQKEEEERALKEAEEKKIKKFFKK